jgi:16S rRNA processing protein RimM
MQSHRVRIAKLSSKSLRKSEVPHTTQLIPLGRLVNTHGVRGELRFLPYAFPCPTLQKGVTVSLQGKDGDARLCTVERVRPHAPFLLVRFQGVTSITHAQTLRDCIVAVEEQLLPPLPEGEFYHYQTVGLHVFTTTDELIGTIEQVFFSGGHDVWVVRHGKKEHMIPVTEEIVRIIDIPSGRVVIEPLAGLFD